MIRFNGYYVFEPFPFLDKKEEHIIEYLIKAFLFKNDGTVIYTNKLSTENENIYFIKKDFENILNDCYKINGNEMYIINKCEENGYKFYYDIISKDKIKYRETGQIMKFIPWKNQK